MAFPAHSRTYYTGVDADLGAPSSNTDLCRRILFGLKAALKKEILSSGRSGATAWTCTGSSDGSTAGIDGTDRWGSTYDSTKIVVAAAASPHSWIVLRNATIGCYICIDAVNATNPTWFISTGAFTGGSASARPTSGAEVQIPASGTGLIPAGTSTYRAHVTSTADGHFIFITGAKNALGIDLAFGVWPVTDYKSGDANPWIAFHTSEGFGYDGTLNAGQWRSGTIVARNVANSAWLTCVPGYWADVANGATYWARVTTGRNYLGEQEFGDLYIVSKSTPTIKGKMQDCFQGYATRHGTLTPLDSSPPKYMGVNLLWFPFVDVPAL